MKEMKVFKAGGSPVVSLAIHPTRPFLLSACADGVIKVWNWENGWACSQQVHLFSDNSSKSWWILVKFNPNDANTFTSRNLDGALKVGLNRLSSSYRILVQSDFDLFLVTDLTGLVNVSSFRSAYHNN
jgi:WD40 repeat protein